MTTPSETPPTPASASYAHSAEPQRAYAPAPQPGFAGTPATTGPTAAGNPIGLIALLLGIVALIGSTVSLLAQAVVIASGDYNALGIIGAVTGSVEGLLAAAAVVCGGIGLALKGRPKATAGIGLGIGVGVLWAVLGSGLYSFVVPLIAG